MNFCISHLGNDRNPAVGLCLLPTRHQRMPRAMHQQEILTVMGHQNCAMVGRREELLNIIARGQALGTASKHLMAVLSEEPKDTP
jgi:hypothetical protein